ncbi:Nicotinamidase-related amidase [Tistlia consotensis]|uniref:Nicotinamidase-related amidase n=1 Tax=Tistlia consotensis USBA 355 TaxID=560819 RepID=A0A1Y6CSH9_9PROT|nr:cysteine hydrolase [Tistlia consotensis]SMF73322.1 Nicotinamidase-related amidase [Tistlia consotensis USBA 355]SNS30684.1 Nicotinamidase-related amidase [Tistlia consotensis]
MSCSHASCKETSEQNVVASSRRRLLLATAGAAVAATGGPALARAAAPAEDPYADPVNPALPKVEMTLDLARTALVVTDPQIDFLSPKGGAWSAFGESITEQNTVPNLRRLFVAAKQARIPVVISPHYYYPFDHRWKFAAPGEALMHKLGLFDRPGPLSVEGFAGSGADWMPEYRDLIEDGETIVCSPHKIAGPQTNDVIFQLRKQRADQVILAGMAANFCVESHLRDFVEHGFEVAVVRDATAASKLPEGDAYGAALVNFRWFANALWTTDAAVELMRRASRG